MREVVRGIKAVIVIRAKAIYLLIQQRSDKRAQTILWLGVWKENGFYREVHRQRVLDLNLKFAGA